MTQDAGHGTQDVLCSSPEAEWWWRGCWCPQGQQEGTQSCVMSGLASGTGDRWRGWALAQAAALTCPSVCPIPFVRPACPVTLHQCYCEDLPRWHWLGVLAAAPDPNTPWQQGGRADVPCHRHCSKGVADVTGSDKAPVPGRGVGAASHGSCLVPVVWPWLWHSGRTPHPNLIPTPQPPAPLSLQTGGPTGVQGFWVPQRLDTNSASPGLKTPLATPGQRRGDPLLGEPGPPFPVATL